MTEEKLKEKFENKMLDPSILLNGKLFLDERYTNDYFRTLKELGGNVFIPKNFLNVSEEELKPFLKFYGLHISPENYVEIKRDIKRKIEDFHLRIYNRKEEKGKIPEALSAGRAALERLNYANAIKEVIKDEFMFLASQSSLNKRCLFAKTKKVFNLFEKANILKVLNLKKLVPKKWRKTVAGAKKIANWVGFIWSFVSCQDPLIQVITASGNAFLIIFDP